jgi:uncharacterized membrane protein
MLPRKCPRVDPRQLHRRRVESRIRRTIHVTARIAGLMIGPVAMVARKRRGVHTRAGEAYHWVFLAVAVSAIVLAALDWSRLWWSR